MEARACSINLINLTNVVEKYEKRTVNISLCTYAISNILYSNANRAEIYLYTPYCSMEIKQLADSGNSPFLVIDKHACSLIISICSIKLTIILRLPSSQV